MAPSNVLVSLLVAAALLSHVPSSAKVTKCETCRELVKGFKEGQQRTARFNFAGGDVAWEEEKKLSYATSETRLVEILESTCEKNNDKCLYMLEEQEELLETWWFKKQIKYPDLVEWLCRIRLRICCPKNTFGKDCQPCPGGEENPCGGYGSCEGEGDREGSGKCVCRAGFTGHVCDTCLEGYYNDTEKDDCLTCHAACVLNCTGPGPAYCTVCNDGWSESPDGCLDVNECQTKNDACSSGQYCVNTEGSFTCHVCHRACANNCTGPGAIDCQDCGNGYEREDVDKECKDINECDDPDDTGCDQGTYCVNTVGSFYCSACDVACAGGCSGSGPGRCTRCADGYEQVESMCEDIDECRSSPCADTEDCTNTFGSFSCDCKPGSERMEGMCTPILNTQTGEQATQVSAEEPPSGEPGNLEDRHTKEHEEPTESTQEEIIEDTTSQERQQHLKEEL